MYTKRIGWFMIAALCFGLLWAGADAYAGPGGKAATAQGVVKIQGEDVIVEVVVAVQPGDKDPKGTAKAALKKMYPDVVPVNYALNGLVWDVFFDGDPDNDRVVVNHCPAKVPKNMTAGDSLNVLLNSMASWTDVVTSEFVFEFGETTDREPSLVKESKGPQGFDGYNDVGWTDIRERNVLGVTWYGTSTDEFDIAIDNKNYTWFFGDPTDIGADEYDLPTVLTHELGHALGLAHSDDLESIMETYYDGPQRQLGQDDEDGVTALYPAEGVDIPPQVAITAPADGSVFDMDTEITFTGTASDEDEDLTALIEWNSDLDGYIGMGGSVSVVLGLGTRVVTASAVDAEGLSGSDSSTVTVREPSSEPTASVDSVTYATSGGRYKDRDLLVTVAVVDDTGQPVVGASVSISLTNDGGGAWAGTGPTIEDGTVTFKLRNAPAGTYTTEVTDVTAAGLVWNGVTPDNSFTK